MSNTSRIMPDSIIRRQVLSWVWYFPYEYRRTLFRLLRPNSYKGYQKMRGIDTDQGYSLKPFVENNCIFVHIPKCAGVSVCKSLFGNLAGGHMKIRKYQLAFSKHEFENYFKFTIVRNPWDRLVSAYFFLKEGGASTWDRIWAEKNLPDKLHFEGFIKTWLNRRNIERWYHFVPQYRFLCEPNSRKIRVDFVGHFESLEEDFLYVQERIGIQTLGLSHFNKTRTRRLGEYRLFYNEETQRIVSNVYSDDIKYFGYKF